MAAAARKVRGERGASRAARGAEETRGDALREAPDPVCFGPRRLEETSRGRWPPERQSDRAGAPGPGRQASPAAGAAEPHWAGGERGGAQRARLMRSHLRRG
ncbi:unnamed protein product [Coccothraustes coccothraustes]